MKCLYISIVLLMYNYMMIFGQLRFHDESSYINVDNGTGITERIPWSSRDSYEEHHCPKNMSLYSVDDAMDVWRCECKRGFLYFPLDNSCYEAYKQGPCSSKNYLVLLENETVARCVENPCLEDGMVPYNGTCYHLKTIGGPCSRGSPIETLDVDETTFQLICMPLPYLGPSIVSAYPSFINTPIKNCPSGSRRSLKSGTCIKV